ncbi:MAG: DUF4347 domain-containing protein [Phycisphaera sp. RhM]|nr:DUF4347 domain-containing protein [Phycisphaera sp. RhM]
MSANHPPRVFDFFLLEDRILLSADGPDTAELPFDADVELLDAAMTQMLQSAAQGASDELFGTHPVDSVDSQSDQPDSKTLFESSTTDPSRPLEVVFVDDGVEDAETLLAGLRDHSDDGTQWLIVRLSSEEDGITQITETLGELSGVDAIHILAHGDGQGLQLGNTRLDLYSANGYAGDISSWAGSLDTDADLLIYGCDLASTAEGRTLIDSIATLCDCDVAASDDLTGAEQLGGDWDLEYTVGSVDAGIAFDTRALSQWNHVLNVYTVTNTLDDGSVGSLRWAIAQSNASTTVDDTIDFAIAGTGVHTISIGSALTITDTVTIDASTDDSFAANGSKPAIKLDGTGAGAVNGLLLAAGSENSTIRGFVIQNFDQSGILIQSTGNTIAGNFIGLDADGTTITANNVSNTTYFGGIRVESDNNTIGGLTAADRNVISGNNYAGLVFVDASSNQVQGNYIGTDAGGTLDRGNSQEGIDLNRGGSNVIGGSNVNARNVISGNDSDGMEIDGSDNNIIQGNYIGTDYTGTQDLGNTRDGIDVNEDAGNGATGNLIGGTGPNEGNLIFGNDLNGVEIRDNPTIENTILGNQIFGNGALGIELGNGDGVTANDASDVDSGSNNLQNFPVLTSAQMVSGTDLNILGSLNGVANSYYRIEFFASTSGDGTGYGEGQRYLGFANVTTDGSGNATINATLTANVLAGEIVSATATKSNVTFNAFTDTSEFAQNITVTNTAPVAADDAYSTSVNATLDVGPTATNLANWWQFDEGAGQTSVDSGALGNDATLGATAGADTDDPTWTTGYVGSGALTFDGSDDYVTTTSTVLKTASSFTLSAWFQTTTTTAEQHILWEGYSGGNGYGSAPGTAAEAEMGLTVGAYNQANKIVFFLGYDVPANGADPIYIVSNSDFTDTTSFHHAAVTVTDLGGGVFSASLYVDGVLEGTDTGVQNDRSAWGNLQIGKPDANTRLFSGQIDEVRVYDTALSAGQVQDIARSGVLQNDSDVDSRAINVNTALVTGPSNGTLSIESDGSFSYTPDANFNGVDSFTYQTNDGSLDSNVATVTITVNDDPVISTSGGSAAYTENAAPTLIDSGFTATDPYSTDLDGGTLTVSFSAGGTSNDQLTVVDGGSVTVVGSTIRHGGTDVATFSGGTGGSDLVITFNANSTPAIAQAIGRQIGYHNTSENPSTAPRTTDFVLTDGDTGTSNTAQRTVNVTAVNDSPTVATNTGTTVLEGSTGTAITTAMLNEGDVDDSGAGLTYTITDVTDNGTMYLAGFGALGLNDTFTQADIDAGDVTYDHDGSETTSDAFSFSLADGGEDGATQATGTFNFTVTPVNDNSPVITSDGGAATAAVNVFENSVYVSTVVASDADLPAPTITYSIIGGVDSTKFAIDGSTGVLTFVAAPDFESPTDVGANNVYDVIVQASDGTYTDTQTIAVTVQDTADDGQFLDLFEVDSYGNSDGSEAWATGWVDSADGSATSGDIKVSGGDLRINVNNVNDNVYRQVDLSGASSASLDLAYANSLTGARTVLLQVSGDGGSNYDTVATLDASTNVGTGTLSIDISAYTAADTRVRFLVTAVGGGGPGGNVQIASLQVGYTPNSAPTITSNGAGATAAVNAAENGTAVTTVTAVDGDVPAQTLTYSIIGGLDSTKFAIDSSSGVLTFVSAPNFESPTDNGGNNVYDVTVQVSDGIDTDTQAIAVTVTDVNESPTVATNTGTTVLEGSTGTAITTAMLNEGDVDDSGAGLTYTITDVTDNGTMYLAGFGALGLNDTFTQADIDAGDVSYDHDGSETTSDAFSFSLADGGEDGATPATGTFNFTITTVNDAPVEASIEGSTLAYTENDGAVAITSTLALSDSDDTNLESAVVQITGNYASGQDVLTFVDQNGISGVWNAGSGTMTLSGTATVAEYEAALRSITYTNSSDNPSTATRTVSFTVNDGDVDSNTQTRDISIAATNDDPTGTGLPSDITVTEDVSSDVGLSALNLTDLDDNGGNLTVTLSTSTGGDLSASTGGGVTVGGSGTGTLTLTGSLADLNTFLDTPANIQYLHGTPHTFGNDADTIQVVVNDGGNTGSGGGTDQTIGTVNVDITAVNDEQVLATNTGDTVPEGSVGNTVTTAMLETTDVDNTDSQLVYTVDVLPTNGTLYRLGSALNVSDTFTQADIDAGLITYDHDGSQTSSDSFDFTVDDGAGTTTSSTFNWTVSNVNDAPVGASIEGSTLAYTENDGAVAITSTLALSDVDDTNLESAVVQITGNYASGEDVLTFVDQNGISGVWNAGSGTMTLSGAATVAEYEAALRSITYTNTSDNPSTATRTVSFTVNDGDVDSNTQTRDISIAATNDDPTGAGLPSDITVTEDVSSDVDLSALNLADLDENGGNLTVTLSTSTGGDLSASTGGGVTVGGSGTGTLTLTGTLADLNTFLDTPANIQYLHGTPHTFGNDADTIQVVVNDGGNTGSGGGTDQTIGTVNVDITAVNDEQVLATNTGDTVPEGSVGNTVTTAMLETTDVDNTDSQLVYTVDAVPTNGTLYRGGVVLNVSDTFTQADLDAGLITYDHDGSETTSDSFDFTVDDGAGATTSSTFNWTVTAGNDAPVEASIEGSTLAYTENDGAVAITSTLALSDSDDTNLESAVVQITGNYASGQDVLSFVDQNGISGVWNAGSGTMTLTGTATVAQYEAALRSITYTNSSDNPSTATRTVSFTVNDGDVDSNTQTRDISIAATNDDPTGTGLPSDITVTEDVSSNVDLSALNLADLDDNGGNLTVTLSTSTGGDLTASTGGGVTVGGSGTGTLTLTGTLADLNTFLDTPANIQYLHGTPHTFGNDADTIQVVVNDGGNTGSGGGTDQTIGTVNVDITAVNDEQVLATNTGDTVPEGSVGNTVTTAMLETTDVDNTDSQLVYTVDALPTNGTLYRLGSALNVSDTFTQADIDAGLITYDHDGSQTSSDSFDFTVDDGAGTTTSSTFNWTVSNVNDAPVEASIEGSTLAYTENDGAVAITSTLALSDVDDTNLESAVVQITGNYTSGEDVLTFVDQNGISGVWNAGSGTMTLTGTATVAEYEAALRSITYTNTSDNPSTATRTVSFTVNDGDVDSNTQTRDISIAATNDDPTGTGLPSDITVTEDVSSNVDLSALNLADLDENGGNLTVTLSTSTGGDLTASTGGGVTVGGSGTGTLTLTGTLADLNTFLDTPANIQYLHGTPHTFGNDADTIQVVVNDGGNTGSGGGTDQTIGTVNVDITAVNDSPNLASNTGMTVAEGATGTAITSGMLSGSDVDDASTDLTYTLTDDVDNGTLTLAGFGTLTLGDTFTQADLDNGDVTYSHDDSETIGDGFGFTLADGGEDGASAIAGTFTITVTPVNDNAISAIADVDPSANSVAEDAVPGTLVGITALASDADAGAIVTYTLDDDAGGRFSIDTTTGIIRVAGALDHETSASETITIRATSSDGSTTTMTNSIAVTDVNEAPAATGEAFTVTIGETLSVGVAGVIFNDTDIDGDALAIVMVAAPTNGTFSLDPGGNFTYTPNAGFFGQDSFFYRVTDGTLSSNVAEVILDVPVAAPATGPSNPLAANEVVEDETPDSETLTESESESDFETEAENAADESETSESTDDGGSSSAIAVPLASPIQGGVGERSSSESAERAAAERTADELAESEQRLIASYTTVRNSASLVLSYSPELEQLERLLRQDLQQAIVWTQWDDYQEQEQSPVTVVVGAAGAGMSVFSIGYVFWALRGGALMSVFASSLPAWRFIDPIAMLSAYRGTLAEKDEGLEQLLSR